MKRNEACILSTMERKPAKLNVRWKKFFFKEVRLKMMLEFQLKIEN